MVNFTPEQGYTENFYIISRKYSYLKSIFNLKPNTLYQLLFNDLYLSFQSNSSGEILFNDNIPVGCLRYFKFRKI